LTEYADPDLETIAPLPPGDDPMPVAPAPGPVDDGDRRRWRAIVAGLVVAALVIGFGVATVILNATDSGSHSNTSAPPAGGSGTLPPTTALADPDESALAGLIVNQDDVPAAYTVYHPSDGINLRAPTLDLCNGTYPSEGRRTARRQVYVGPTDNPGAPFVFSTEAVLYHAPDDAAQALGELRSVSANCPPTPVVSPVPPPNTEATAITKFSAPPDTSWPHNPAVQRQAYAFVTTIPNGNQPPQSSVAVYLRRGRVLMGLYFPQPNSAQVPIEGHATIQQIVAVFEARIAQLPAHVVNG
jgi:hypothetical protein